MVFRIGNQIEKHPAGNAEPSKMTASIDNSDAFPNDRMLQISIVAS
jgi:hypothetical protein